MSLRVNPSPWRPPLFVGLLVLGAAVLVARAKAAEPPRRPLNEEQRQKLKEINRLHAERQKLGREGKLEEAIVVTEKELALLREVFGKEHKNVVVSLRFLARLQERREDWTAARRTRQEVLAVQQHLYGQSSWHVTDTRLALEDLEQRSRMTAKQRGQLRQAAELNRQFGRLNDRGKYREAVPVVQQELALRKEVLGEKHPTYIISLNNLAGLYQRCGDYAKAELLFQKALALRKEVLGEKHPAYASGLNNLAALYFDRSDYAKAEPLFQKALTLRNELLGEKHADYAQSLNNLATLYRSMGAYAKAEPLFRKALTLYKELRGEKHVDYAHALSNLAGLYEDMGAYAKAEPLFQKVLTLYKELLGENHPAYALALNNLALLYSHMGAYGKAEPLLHKALALRKELVGEKHPAYALALNNLAGLYQNMGAYAKAEPLYQQALSLRKQVLGEKHTDYANSLNNLALLYENMGDYAKAEPLCQKALALSKELLGEKHPGYALGLNNLAGLYQHMRAYAKAEPLFQQALTLNKELLGEKHPGYANSLNNLASLYRDMGSYAKAEPLYQEALALNKELLGERHPGYANNLNNLALLYKDMGSYAKAEPLYQQALTLNKQLLGEQHPQYTVNLNNLALLYLANEDARQGEPLARQAAENTRSLLERTASVQSERQQLAMTTKSRWYLDSYLSLTAAAKTPADEVYAVVLAWKGAVSARQQHLHLQRQHDQRPEIRKLYTELQEATARLAQLSHASSDPKRPDQLRRDLDETSDDIERIQRNLARLSEPFRQHLQQQRMAPAELRKALPQGTALVDLLEYKHCQPAAKGREKWVWQRRLTAFVLRPGEPVARLDLGPAKPIRQAVTQWRKHFGLGEAGTAAGGRLRRLLWKPLEQHLGSVSTVLVSPDGVLGKLPWAALPGRKPDTYLLEERAIAILPIPQQLPQLLQRPQAPADESASLLLVGDVDYGADPGRPGTAVAARSAPRGDRASTRGTWSPLRETRQEILSVRDSFEQRYAEGKVKMLRKGQATEEAVRQQASRHRYLHFATHGFFAPESMGTGFSVASREKDDAASRSGQRDVSGFHPGLLSGLVLAGANRAASTERDDGILTALEVGVLDLSGTELAVLSACETGLGAEAGGEGLLGLQRAFQVAGTRSVVAGLWTVDDRATRALMVDFYDNLWSKKLSRLEALRQAQLSMLREGIKRGLDLPPDQPRRLSPFYWAAFVLSGDWR